MFDGLALRVVEVAKMSRNLSPALSPEGVSGQSPGTTVCAVAGRSAASPPSARSTKAAIVRRRSRAPRDAARRPTPGTAV